MKNMTTKESFFLKSHALITWENSIMSDWYAMCGLSPFLFFRKNLYAMYGLPPVLVFRKDHFVRKEKTCFDLIDHSVWQNDFSSLFRRGWKPLALHSTFMCGREGSWRLCSKTSTVINLSLIESNLCVKHVSKLKKCVAISFKWSRVARSFVQFPVHLKAVTKALTWAPI